MHLINMLDLLRKRESPFEAQGQPSPSEATSTTIRRGDLVRYSISDESVATLSTLGYNYLFPIQQATYEYIYEGKDLIGKDRTGSGKTLAFALPVLERLRKRHKYFTEKKGQKPYAMVLVPTRELAMQVSKEFDRLKNSKDEYRVLALYGGTDINEQIFKLKAGVEIIVGTPGRVIDLFDRKELNMKRMKVVIMDETDQMLNFGFQEDIEKILSGLKAHLSAYNRKVDEIQFLLFSATLPKWIDKITENFMKSDVIRVDMIKDSEVKTSTTVDHYCIPLSTIEQKFAAISDVIIVYGGANSKVIIFTNTKEEANYIGTRIPSKHEAKVLHGDILQTQREEIFESFRSGKLKCLIATNVAARGLDIPEIDLIIQLSPPKDIDAYIHRSGRTGRAGKKGICITFYTPYEKDYIDKIEYRAGIQMLTVSQPQPDEVLKATAKDIGISIGQISPDMISCFSESVDTLLQKFEPKEALSRALALLTSQSAKSAKRSLLLSAEGYVTYIMEVEKEIDTISYFLQILKKEFGHEIHGTVRGMRFLASKKGVVFDMEERLVMDFEERIARFANKKISIQMAKVIPTLQDLPSPRSNSISIVKGRKQHNNTKTPYKANTMNNRNPQYTHRNDMQYNPIPPKHYIPIKPSNEISYRQSERGPRTIKQPFIDQRSETGNESKTTFYSQRPLPFDNFFVNHCDNFNRYNDRVSIDEREREDFYAHNNPYMKPNRVDMRKNSYEGFNLPNDYRYSAHKEYQRYSQPELDHIRLAHHSYQKQRELSDNLSDDYIKNSINNKYNNNKRDLVDIKYKDVNNNKMESKSYKAEKPIPDAYPLLDNVETVKRSNVSIQNKQKDYGKPYEEQKTKSTRFQSKDEKPYKNKEETSKRNKERSDNGKKQSDRERGRKKSYDDIRDKKTRENRKDRDRDRTYDEGEIEQKDLAEETKLFVSNLGDEVDSRDLNHYLSRKDIKVNEAYLVKNQEGRSKGFGYVSFKDARTTKRALKELEGAKINGKCLRVCYAMKKKNK